MIIVPLIFASITYAVAALGDPRKLQKIGTTTLLYYLATTVLAVLVGITLINLIKPGVGADIGISEKVAGVAVDKGQTLIDTIAQIVPENIMDALASSNILQIVFFGIVLGIALGIMKKRHNLILRILHEVNEAILIIIGWILNVIPYGVGEATSSLIKAPSMKPTTRPIAILVLSFKNKPPGPQAIIRITLDCLLIHRVLKKLLHSEKIL